MLRTEEEDKVLNKLDRMIREAGPLDQNEIPDWMSKFEIKAAEPKPKKPRPPKEPKPPKEPPKE